MAARCPTVGDLAANSRKSGNGHYGHRMAISPMGIYSSRLARRQSFYARRRIFDIGSLGKGDFRIHTDWFCAQGDNPFLAKGAWTIRFGRLGHTVNPLGICDLNEGALWLHGNGARRNMVDRCSNRNRDAQKITGLSVRQFNGDRFS